MPVLVKVLLDRHCLTGLDLVGSLRIDRAGEAAEAVDYVVADTGLGGVAGVITGPVTGGAME